MIIIDVFRHQVSVTIEMTMIMKLETNTLKAISKSLGISSVKAVLSNELSIALSRPSDATHEQNPTSITSQSTNESRIEDDFNMKLSSTINTHWIIMPSAVAGGLLLILLVIISLKIKR